MGERRDLNSSRGRGNFDEGYPNEYAQMPQHDARDTRSQSSGALAASDEFSRGRGRNRGRHGRDDRHRNADVSHSKSMGTGFGGHEHRPGKRGLRDTYGGGPKSVYYDYQQNTPAKPMFELGGRLQPQPQPPIQQSRAFQPRYQPSQEHQQRYQVSGFNPAREPPATFSPNRQTSMNAPTIERPSHAQAAVEKPNAGRPSGEPNVKEWSPNPT